MTIISFITDDMLIVGCDIGSETHYIRAIDVRGRELSRGAFEFSNDSEGFENAKAWVLALAAKMRKLRIDTVRLKLLKIATRVVRSARYTTFKLCSSCPYKNEFYETLQNIRQLQPQLE